MIILGMHFGHDAAVVLLKDGVIIASLEKERLNRIKHTMGLDYNDIQSVLEQVELESEDVDFCTVTSTQDVEYLFFNPDKFSFVIGGTAATEIPSPYAETILANGGSLDALNGKSTVLDIYKNNTEHFYRLLLKQYEQVDITKVASVPSIEDFFIAEEWRKGKSLANIAQTNCAELLNDHVSRSFHLPITLNLDGCKIPGALFSHHYAHAAYAYYESNFSSAAILSHDGGSVRRGYRAGMFYFADKGRLYPLAPHYLFQGWMYYTVAFNLGLGSTGGSGKLMGLAAYGQPHFYHRNFVGNWYDSPLVQEKKHPEQWFNYALSVAEQEGYDISALSDKTRITEPINADIAASTQKIFEETMLCGVDTLAGILKASGLNSPNLCLAGGTTLNCPANTRIFNESDFEKVFAPPGCDDSGLAAGSAYALYYNILGFSKTTQTTNAEKVYRGKLFHRNNIWQALETFKDVVEVKTIDNPALAAAKMINEDKILGWFEGRSEIGPRALGHRSFVANPTKLENWTRLNQIKNRENWRPLAPSVLADQADKWFKEAPISSPFMLFNARVNSEKIPAITHVDGTARIQTVSPENGLYFELLQAFYQLSGIPVVMNTSFNGPGEPIVESPEDALQFFVSSELDALFLDGIQILHTNKK